LVLAGAEIAAVVELGPDPDDRAGRGARFPLALEFLLRVGEGFRDGSGGVDPIALARVTGTALGEVTTVAESLRRGGFVTVEAGTARYVLARDPAAIDLGMVAALFEHVSAPPGGDPRIGEFLAATEARRHADLCRHTLADLLDEPRESASLPHSAQPEEVPPIAQRARQELDGAAQGVGSAIDVARQQAMSGGAREALGARSTELARRHARDLGMLDDEALEHREHRLGVDALVHRHAAGVAPIGEHVPIDEPEAQAERGAERELPVLDPRRGESAELDEARSPDAERLRIDQAADQHLGWAGRAQQAAYVARRDDATERSTVGVAPDAVGEREVDLGLGVEQRDQIGKAAGKHDVVGVVEGE
jgi:DNA-binding IscR family transcriptional regulator